MSEVSCHAAGATQKPRILFVSYTSDWTGPTNSLLLLLSGLRCHYDVTVLLPGQGIFAEVLAREGIRFLSLPSLSRSSIPAIMRLIRQHGFTVVYANNSSSSSRNAMIAARLARVPFICHVREMGWSKSWRQMGYLRLANAVIAVSRACADSIARFVPCKRLHVVHNGTLLPTEKTEPKRAARSSLVAAANVSMHPVVMVNLAHLAPRKGQEHAIEVMASIVTEMRKVHLVFIGSLDRDPAYVESLRTMVRDMQLESHVSFLGFRQDALQLLAGADLLVHTATADPHPRAVIEGMAAGLPVVAFAVDGVEETVVDNVTGFLVPLRHVAAMAERVRRLVASPALRVQMGSAARHRAETFFSTKATCEKVMKIIDSQCGKHVRKS